LKFKFSKKFVTVLAFVLPLFFGVSTSAATFDLTPSTDTFEIGCTTELVISIDATGESSNAAEIIINYDPTDIDIIDSDSTKSGTQIQTGNAYSTYFYNDVDEGTGEIRLAGASYSDYLTSQRVFGIIEFEGLPGAGSTTFTIDFDGAGSTFTFDSNIADSSTNLDLLTGVTNGTYSFIVGPCGIDTVSPSIFFNSPTNGQSGFPANGNIVIRVTDDSSGVDLNEVQFVVNGISFTPSSPEVSYVGTSFDYTFTINPSFSLNTDEPNSIVVIAQDQAGNEATSQNIFNIPTSEGGDTVVTVPEDNTPPTVLFTNPKNLDVNVPEDSQIEVDIIDDLSDINQDSVKIYINDDEYVISDPEVTIIENTSKDISLVVTPRDLIDQDTYTVIRVVGEDIDGNKFDRQIIINLPDAEESGITQEQCQELVDEALTEAGVCEVSQDSKPNDIERIITSDNFINVASAGGSAILVFSALPLLLTILSVPGALFQFIGVFLGRSQKKPWGIIKDAITGKPLSFAICNIYQQGSSFKTGQVITDLEGRYGFSLNPGNYRLEVRKAGYKTFSTTIKIIEKYDSYVYDVELSPATSTSTSKVSAQVKLKNILINNFNKVSRILFISGFAISLFSLSLDQSALNFIIVILYTVMAFINILPKLTERSKYASVVSEATDLRIPFAQIKIFDPESMKLIDTKTTNQDGYFDFYGEPGKYAILVIARGFKFPSGSNVYDKTGPSESMLLVDLKRGGNKISLYVEQESKDSDIDELTNGLRSPFK
jgi:hypothetical protein